MKSKVIIEDKVLKKIAKRLKGQSATVEVGILDGEIAAYGLVHEYGAPGANIPERSFLRSTFDEQQSTLEKMLQEWAGGLVDGKTALRPGLTAVGRFLQGAVKRKIRSGPFAPLAPATIAAKGSSRPLIDTGALRAAIVFHVDVDASVTSSEGEG